ncbi:MAG: alcohol dehydrogenase catalytic domain-containing protein [Caldilineaceae bacterium]
MRIALHTVGICGSDVHYYTHGAIGPFVVREPMVLGHEAAGTVVEVGDAVTNPGCGRPRLHEPGIPRPQQQGHPTGHLQPRPGRALLGPPRPSTACCVPPWCTGLCSPSNRPTVSALPKARWSNRSSPGLHAATKARIKPGDVAVVTGAGPIGMVMALSAALGWRLQPRHHQRRAAARAGLGCVARAPSRR